MDQFAGLCWRRVNGRLEYVLVTSRRTGRWIFPKGGADPDETPGDTAAREALEEAGVDGRPGGAPVGRYRILKVLAEETRPLTVELWPVEVLVLRDVYPEAGLRDRCVLDRDRALGLLDQDDMRVLLLRFDPKLC